MFTYLVYVLNNTTFASIQRYSIYSRLACDIGLETADALSPMRSHAATATASKNAHSREGVGVGLDRDYPMVRGRTAKVGCQFRESGTPLAARLPSQ